MIYKDLPRHIFAKAFVYGYVWQGFVTKVARPCQGRMTPTQSPKIRELF